MAKPKILKKNTVVAYQARVQSGVGKITEIKETVKGLWYTVRDSSTEATVKLRASALTPQ